MRAGNRLHVRVVKRLVEAFPERKYTTIKSGVEQRKRKDNFAAQLNTGLTRMPSRISASGGSTMRSAT